MSDVMNNPEARENDFRQAVEEGVLLALEKISVRFETAKESLDNLAFHNTEHTRGVMERTEIILRALRDADTNLVSEREVLVGRLAAANHDTVQEWKFIEVPDGPATKKIRQRFTGSNEKASGEEAVTDMHRLNQQFGSEIFTSIDEHRVREAVEATVPGFDPALGTVIQPNLRPESSYIARAVALADLGAAGMGVPEEYSRGGDALFREENLDILQDVATGSWVSEEIQERYKKRILVWLKSQPAFARGRQLMLEKEIAQFPESAHEAVRKLFYHFDETVAAATKRAEHCQTMSFPQLVKEMGYKAS